MDFITSQQQPIETAGSHLIGVVVASYDMIKTAFGNPCGAFDDYKSQVEWEIQFEDGTIATIYDWKEGDCYHGEGQGTHFSKVTEWHIGGFNQKAEDRVLEVLASIKAMVDAGTPLEDIPPRVFDQDRRKEEMRLRLIDIDVEIEELQEQRKALEDQYYSMEGEVSYE